MNLVYFVIGGEPSYTKLLEYCISTIRRFSSVDILVMCDAAYATHVKHLPVKIFITPDNQTHIQASMRRTEIFSFPEIDKYEKILYLDCDIVVCGSLEPIYERITDPTKLYVKPEPDAQGAHTQMYWRRGDRMYDQETLDRFKEKDIRAFNSGQFGFINSAEMRDHFNVVAREIRMTAYDPRVHFYEQVFMNDHFNRAEATSYDIADLCAVFNAADPAPLSLKRIVNHFANASCHHLRKLALMQESDLRTLSL